ncbi:MAG: hypothetical protein MK105_16645 [Crocinitomicaceae bacterium]|nr:hypothetical protein [Crocinitomicaceae bacterium]
MNDLKSKIGKGGLILAAMGVISIVLSVFNYNVRLLAWVDLWGDTMGWVIRILLIVLGGGIFFLFGRNEETETK